VKWTIVSGPGPAFILSDISLVTPVIFPTLGLYVLRLTANDGQVKTASDVLVNVVANPNISIEATIPTGMEFGPIEAEFSFYRDGSTNLSLTLPFLISGSASNGVDYVALSNSVVIPPGATFVTLCIVPLLDTLAEGDETVTLTLSLTQGPVGGPGTNTRATIVIRDRPWDDWRMTHFTMSELTNLTISGESGDVDQDGLFNLWEFSQNRLPRVADASSGFTASIEPWPATGQNHLVTSFKRRLPPSDLLYEVEVSTNLVHWASGPAVTAEILPVIQDGNGLTETARVRVLAPVSLSSAQFVRLKVSLR
jgi:hypothetical protein